MVDLKKVLCLIIVLSNSFAFANSLNDMMSYYIEQDFIPDANENKEVWTKALTCEYIVHDWQGNEAYPFIKTKVNSLWSDEYIYFIYTAPFEKLTVDKSIQPDSNGDCWGIWNFDVVEIFIGDGPDKKKYKEFVLSPIGQKIDIIHNKNLKKEDSYDTDWNSGWQSAVKVDKENKIWITEFRIPLKKLRSEQNSNKFHFNLFRCEGAGEDRKYLALNPTLTSRPNFHVSEKFGILELKKQDDVLPKPILKIDFEDKLQNESFGVSKDVQTLQGIAKTQCLNLYGDNSNVISISDKDLLNKLSGAKSLTITGWMRRKINFDDENYTIPVVLNCQGSFQITFGKWGRMALIMEGADGRRKQIWSSWVGITDLTTDDRWVFFAFSYDGTKGGINSAFYNGYEIYPITRDVLCPADSGQKEADPDDHWSGGSSIVGSAGMLKEQAPKAIIVGASTVKGDRKLDGMIDSIRIYASNKDSSAALNRAQIEEIRQQDLGNKWIEEKIIEKARKDLKAKQYMWAIEDELWGNVLNAHQVDILDRIYPDIPPQPMKFDKPRMVPRGGDIAFQFAVMHRSKKAIQAKMNVPKIKGLKARVKTYELLHVPVESNNNGGIRTTISSRPPEIWMENIIRKAPFELAEVMVETDKFGLRQNNMHDVMYKGLLVDIEIDKNAKLGIYNAVLNIETDNEKTAIPFQFEVSKIVIDDFPKLNNIYWFKANPKNLSNSSELPELWSKQHWQLIRNSAQTLRDFGQNTISISLMMHSDETVNFIQTIKKTDGTYDFDFSLFDKWFKTFREVGFINLEGECTFGGHKGGPQKVRAFDEKIGEYVQIFDHNSQIDQWLNFVGIFYKHLYAHLQQKGWAEYYVQAICDEPTNLELYIKAYNLTKEIMPGIRTKEACGNSDYSNYIDIQVFNSTLAKSSYQRLARQLRSEGKGVWFYHCASPYPPYPNRHLDEALTSSRLYPWLTYMLNADGYLFWAANNYRGANPYKSSIGPLPGGVTNPGHPPGDNWMYYPGPNGLRGSMRMIAFREGLLDHALLVMLEKESPDKVEHIVNDILHSPVDYQKDPISYHKARNELLNTLDSLN